MRVYVLLECVDMEGCDIADVFAKLKNARKAKKTRKTCADRLVIQSWKVTE